MGPWKEQRRDTGGEGPRVDESQGATRTRVLGSVTQSRWNSRGPGSTLGRGGGPTRRWGSPRALQSQHRVVELLTELDTQPPSVWWFRKFGRTWVKNQCKWEQRGLWSKQKLRDGEGLASHLIWTGLRTGWWGSGPGGGGPGPGGVRSMVSHVAGEGTLGLLSWVPS